MIWDNNEDIRLVECENNKRAIQRQLNACREERRRPTKRRYVPIWRVRRAHISSFCKPTTTVRMHGRMSTASSRISTPWRNEVKNQYRTK